MTEERIAKNAHDMAVKLSGCAEEAAERVREKWGEEAKLPGYVRLMYSAAKVVTELYENFEEQNRKLKKAVSALTENASCVTCKHRCSKKCPVEKECGKEHLLWEFEFE